MHQHTRGHLFRSIAQKLYVEYTSRGFELAFPGTAAKGQPRHHPTEIALLNKYAKQTEDERERLTCVRRQCIREVASIARRRNEQYTARQQALARQRRDVAARRMKVWLRRAVARSKRRKECRLQQVAAAVIQRLYRRRRDRERARRARQQHRRDLVGLSFRYARRVNRTLVLINVSVNEIDSRVGAIELVLRAWHPSAGNAQPAAPIRITQPELERIVLGRTLCADPPRPRNSFSGKAEPLTRREVVDIVICEHLDVFRSAQHGLLVLSAIAH